MLILFAALITIVALAAIAYPLFRRPTQATDAEGSRQAWAPVGAQPHQEQLEELLAQRDAAVQALRELSFDRQVGKITDQDFGVFETNLKLTAAGAYRALDEWEDRADTLLGPAFAEALSARQRGLHNGAKCPSCGRAADAADRFCATCGAALLSPAAAASPTPAQMHCPHCGQAAAADDRFCAGCGQPLPERTLAG